MPLIYCPDCKAVVSDRAPACPQCGCPIAPVTTERTSKRWKSYQLASIIILLWAASFAIGAHAFNSVPMAVLGALSALTSAGLWIAGRAGAWWHHG